MKCLETRRKGVARWRRYLKPDGTTTLTYEVPLELWNEIVKLAGKPELGYHSKDPAPAYDKTKLQELLTLGWKPDAIAHELGIHVNTVYYYRKRGVNGDNPRGEGKGGSGKDI